MTTPQPPALGIEKSVDPKIFEAIGLLVVAASYADTHLGLQIIRLISPVGFISYHAMPLVAGTDFNVKLAMLRILTSMFAKRHAHLFSEASDNLQRLYKRRNNIAHCLVLPSKTAGEATIQGLKVSSKGGFPSPQIIRADDLRKDARKIYAWVGAVESMLNSLGYPTEGPTLNDVTTRKPASQKSPPAHKTHTHRTTRKTPQSSRASRKR